MKHGSLFSGIGGFDLAAKWMGWENVFQVEIDSFCQKVLQKNFPHTKRYGDIKEFDGTKYRGKVDIVSGGFPCQTFSIAGTGKLDLSLWKEMFRTIREIQPAFVLAENVPGIVSRKRGMAFDVVCSDLENFGYEVQPLNIPIAGKGAPHERERIWFVAYSKGFGRKQWNVIGRSVFKKEESRATKSFEKPNPTFTDLPGKRLQRSVITNRSEGKKCNGKFFDGCNREWERPWYEVATRLCRMDARVSDRMDRIKSLGNSISPQIAYEIFKAIEKAELK